MFLSNLRIFSRQLANDIGLGKIALKLGEYGIEGLTIVGGFEVTSC